MAEFNRLPTKEELSRMLYQMQLGGKSNQDIINDNLNAGSTVRAIPDNLFQKMAGGARIAKEQVNKLGTAADVAKMFPGYTGQKQVNIPTGFNFAPKQDPMGGVVPQGLQTQQVNVDQLLKAIKPADVLGITGAQQAYTDIGMGKAPNPMDVLDVAGLGAAGLGAGKGLLGVAKATKGLPVGMSIQDVSSPFDVVRRDASDIFGAGAERVIYIEPKSGGSIDVLVRPDQPASVMSLEVPEAFRGKKIGESLQAQVLQDFPSMQGQVSSKAAAKTAYRLGRRPADNPNASLEDVFKMIDDNSSVNMVSPQMQSKVGGLLGVDDNGIKYINKKEAFKSGIVDEKIGNSTISYQLGNDGILKIFSLRTPQLKRGQGSASNAMNEITKRADEMGIPIKLDASPLDKKTSLNKLVNFYKKFGFEPTGEKVNMLGEPVMYREPSK